MGCVVLAIVALTFSDLTPARISALLQGEVRPGLPTPLAVAPKPIANATGVGLPTEAGVPQENTPPAPTSEAVDHSSHVAVQPARPQPAISTAAPARLDRPVQRPPAAEPANRPQMTMGLSKPRVSNPAVPANAAAPDFNNAAIAPPPAPLMDLQSLGGRPTDTSKPSRPAGGSNYQQPVLLSRVEPAYSNYARDARLQGTVQISFTIGTDGVPRSLARVNGNSALADMAFEAVRRWRYQPATSDGQPVEAQTTVSFAFQLR